DDPRESAVRDAAVDPRPGLAVVTGPIEVGAEVVVLVHRRREVGRALVAPPGFDRVDLDPRGDAGGRDVLPGLAVVAGDVHQAVVAARPDHAGLHGRLRQGEDRVVDLHAGDVGRDRPARLPLLRAVVAGQVGRHLLPRLSSVTAP